MADGKFLKGHIPWNKKCSTRGTPEYHEKMRIATKERIKKYGAPNKNRKFSIEARINFSKAHLPLNHEWKHFISSIRKRMYYSLENQNWRKAVFERDNYVCQQCGTKGNDVIAHHIKFWKDYPSLRYDIDNGVTLHINCHKEIHRILRNNPDNWEEN